MHLFLEWISRRKLILVGGIVMTTCVLITFYPATKLGFFLDDWWQVANAGRMNLPQYLRFVFDPAVQTLFYRPVFSLWLFVEYPFYGSNAESYHVMRSLLQAADGLLFFAIVYQVSRNLRLGLVSGILFVVLFPGSTAVYGISMPDPLSVFFSLMTLLFWVDYLNSERRWYFGATALSFALALLTKETNIGLILTVFLTDRLLMPRRIGSQRLLLQYGILGLIFLIYLAIEYSVQLHGHFPNRSGYSIGFHVFENAIHYLGVMVFPWNGDQRVGWICLAFLLLLIVGAGLGKPRQLLKNNVVWFLSLQAVLAIAPVSALPTEFFELRYLYSASMVAAILIALMIEKAWTSWAKYRGLSIISPAVLALLAVLYSASTMDAAASMAEFNRELRVPFHDIVLQHPSFPPDSYLYLINPPYLLRHASPSLFFFQYGSNVSIGTPFPEWWGGGPDPQVAGLREHKNSIIYFFDGAGRRQETPVDYSATVSANPAPPIAFQNGIQLEGYEISHAQLNRTDNLVVLLYWHAKAQVDRDYTVFIRLVDKTGRQIAGEDSQPYNGLIPTTSWKTDKLVVDPHVLPIVDAPVGQEYHLEVGLYYLPTMERVAIDDATTQKGQDMLIMEPFGVKE